MNNEKIECIRFKPYSKGPLQGFADFYVTPWGIEINGFSVYKKDDKQWINLPGQPYEDKDGSKKFKPVFFFKEKENWENFMYQLKQALESYRSKHAEPQESYIDNFF